MSPTRIFPAIALLALAAQAHQHTHTKQAV